MSETSSTLEKHVTLTPQQAEQLQRLSQVHQLTEEQLIAKALDILFSVTELLDTQLEQPGWSALTENTLQRVWDNEEDSIYDNWKELYGLPTR